MWNTSRWLYNIFFFCVVAFVVTSYCSLGSSAIIYRQLISLRKPHWSLKQQICRTFILFSIFFGSFLVFSWTFIHLYNFWMLFLFGELLMFVSVTLHSMEFWSHWPPVFRFFFVTMEWIQINLKISFFHYFFSPLSTPFQSKAEKNRKNMI